MRWRFDITDPNGTVYSMNEPEGFMSGIIGLTRHPELHTLIRMFKSSLRAYGSNGSQDGLRDTIKNIESVFGPDVSIFFDVYVAHDDYTFVLFAHTEIGIQTITEGLDFDHYLEFTPVQIDFWRKFMARFETPVDIQSTLSLDGESVTVLTPETIRLTNQRIRSRFYGYVQELDPFFDTTPFPWVVGHFLQIDVEKVLVDEIQKTEQLPRAIFDLVPFAKFKLVYGGDYLLNLRIEAWVRDNTPTLVTLPSDTFVKFYVVINDDIVGRTALTETNYGSPGYESTVYTMNLNFPLLDGDVIRIYGEIIADLSTVSDPFASFQIVGFATNTSPSGAGNVPGTYPTSFEVVADTDYPDTQGQAVLQHDVAAAILDRITTPDKFYSELIGSQYTQARTYADAGAWWNNLLMKGVHARDYSFTEKLLSLSFKDFWEGFSPMFNPSLGYETIDGVERIVIRTKAEAYDSSSMSVLLSGVQRIKRKYGPDYFNGVDTAFAKGKTEDVSGIDDTQKESRASIFKNIGRKITIATNWIAQGLTIEHARRTTKIKSADYKYDDDIFIIEATRTGANAYDPRLNEDFDSVTNLTNEATRYNKHHTPARFFLRWLDYLSGCLQSYVGTVFRFTGGEGNYDMVSEMVPGSATDDYSGDPLAENADIAVGSVFLWTPKIYEIDHYLTLAEFDTIDANRNLSIGVSQSSEDHEPFFIDDLQLEIMTSQVKIIGKFKNDFDIVTVPPGSQIFQGGRIFDATFSIDFE